ncbi:hypothetical protein HDV05_004420 [Chytridiales sp. JEL 0842]|nr:hypothetical protein HDV05_004420 [Chytridiales sp. JEL 0842]
MALEKELEEANDLMLLGSNVGVDERGLHRPRGFSNAPPMISAAAFEKLEERISERFRQVDNADGLRLSQDEEVEEVIAANVVGRPLQMDASEAASVLSVAALEDAEERSEVQVEVANEVSQNYKDDSELSTSPSDPKNSLESVVEPVHAPEAILEEKRTQKEHAAPIPSDLDHARTLELMEQVHSHNEVHNDPQTQIAPSAELQPSLPTSSSHPHSEPPTCVACSNPIHEIPIEALNKLYHPSHFACSGCETLLSTETFYARDSEPFCKECYTTAFAASCAYCSEIILEKCITALGRQWHPEHFMCSCCGSVFGPGTGFLEKDGEAYCEDDYHALFSPPCFKCKKPILGEYLSALNTEFHPHCFGCFECGEKFVEGLYFEFGGRAYCELHHPAPIVQPAMENNHYLEPMEGKRGQDFLPDLPNRHMQSAAPLLNIPPRCPTCNIPVVQGTPGTVYDPQTGGRFHPGHFVCGMCSRTLEGGVVVEVGFDEVGRFVEREAGLTRGERMIGGVVDGFGSVCVGCY